MNSNALLSLQFYIIEIKYKTCPTEASSEARRKLLEKALYDGLKQIIDRGYAKKYAGCGKKLYQVAFAFLGADDIGMRAAVAENSD